jgi:hypothetical protein
MLAVENTIIIAKLSFFSNFHLVEEEGGIVTLWDTTPK